MTTVPNIALISSTNGTYTTVTTFNVTVTSTTSGSGLFLGISNEVSASTSFVSSITGGGTWVQVNVTTSSLSALELWYCAGATSGVTTVTVNLASSLIGRYCYGEFSGILATGALDVSAVNNSTASNTVTATTGTVAQEVELDVEVDLICNVGKGGNAAAPPSGFIALTTNGTGSSNKMNMNYKIRTGAVSTESVSVVFGAASNASFNTVVLGTFKAVTNVIQQRNIVSSNSSTSIAIAAPRPGNLQTILIYNQASGATSISQTNATWVKAVSSTATSSAAELWYSANASASAGTTITLGTTSAYAYIEWYNLATSSVLDKTVGFSAATGGTSINMVTGTTATTSQSIELALAALGGLINNSSGTWSSVINGYASIASTTTGGNAVNAVFKILTSTGTTSTGATLSPVASTANYSTALATFNQNNPSITGNGNYLLLGVG